MSPYELTNQDPRHSHMVGRRVQLVVDGVTWRGTLSWSGLNENLNSLWVVLERTPLRVSESELNSLELDTTPQHEPLW